MNKKPWYEKLSIWITIFAGMCTILGVSIFGNKSLIKKDINTNIYLDENRNNEDENKTLEDLTNYNSVQNIQSTKEGIYILDVAFVKITSDILKVRTEPNFDSTIITLVAKDENFLLLDIIINDNGDTWYKIIIDTEEFDGVGYIISDYAVIIPASSL